VATVPVFVNETTSEVVAIVEAAMKKANFDDFQLSDDVWLDTMEEAIAEVEQSRSVRDPSAALWVTTIVHVYQIG
jgi:hypothetical protein